MPETIKILFAEDDKDLRESIENYLILAGFSVTAVSNGLDYYKALSANCFSIALIDIGLPDQSGIILAEYTRKNTQLKIIILTALNSIDARVNSYESGADLFLSKPVDCKELVAAIKSLAKRYASQNSDNPDQTADKSIWILEQQGARLKTPEGKYIKLTHKEFLFIEALASSPCAPLARDNLLSIIYPRSDKYSSQALDALVRRLRIKIIKINGEPQPILTAYGVGYSFSAQLQTC